MVPQQVSAKPATKVTISYRGLNSKTVTTQSSGNGAPVQTVSKEGTKLEHTSSVCVPGIER
jgi:hypothetical protein